MLSGMMLQIDRSERRCFTTGRYYARSTDGRCYEIYHARLEAEGTRAGKGCAKGTCIVPLLVRRRAGHFVVTPERCEGVDASHPT